MPLGARAKCTKRHLLVDRFGHPLFSQSVQNEHGTGKNGGSLPQNLREPWAQKDTCHPQNLREDGAQKGTGHPQDLRVAPAKNGPTPEQKPALLKESRDIDHEGSNKGKAPERRGDWERKLKKLFPHELEKLKSDLLRQQKALEPGDPAIADLSCRIEAIDVALYGAPTPKAALRTGKPVRKAPEQKQLTEEELRAGAEFCAQNGKTNLLNKAQKALLAK
jgi:hypothetical protein